MDVPEKHNLAIENHPQKNRKWLVNYVWTLANSGFFKNFLYQGGVTSTVFWVFEDLKFKISEGYDQFGSEPSEILNLSIRSSTTPETVAFTLPW